MEPNMVPRPANGLEIIEHEDGMTIRREDTIHILNITGAELFSLCDGTRTVQEITAEFMALYTSEETISSAMTFLDQLNTNRLLEV